MNDEEYLDRVIWAASLSRRNFLKWSSALSGTVMLSGGIKSISTPLFQQVQEEGGDDVATTGAEKAYTAICPNMGCHQNCAITAYVRDGQLVRVSQPIHPGIPEFDHICLRGLASWQLPYLSNRL